LQSGASGIGPTFTGELLHAIVGRDRAEGGNREDALDLSQDVFLKAYQNLRKLDDPARFGPWLYRIAQ
jgi:DNA-directed RNA polymerase specialized sigma24 family protein